jgi:hypothetical protein
MRRIGDLRHWPPSNFGGYGPGGGDRNPTHASQVAIKDVLGVTSGHVHFSCVFEGEQRTCDFYVPDQKTADQVAAVLKNHTGENLLSIREEAIPEG